MKQLILFPFDPEPVAMPDLDSTTYVHFESIDPEENRYRFYTITWQKTLWGEWAICATWGRIGGMGRSKVTLFESQGTLREALPSVVALRLERGYEVRGAVHSMVCQQSSADSPRIHQLSTVSPKVDTMSSDRPLAARFELSWPDWPHGEEANHPAEGGVGA
jgi:predicted DNA-binding WGR domain protein